MPKKTARSPSKTPSKPKTRSTRPSPRHVQAAKHAHVLDACDLKLTEADATPDEDLPAAEGGVA